MSLMTVLSVYKFKRKTYVDQYMVFIYIYYGYIWVQMCADRCVWVYWCAGTGK